VDIVEASDWVGQLPDSQEVNGGVYCFDVAWLRANIGLVKPSATGERHLPWLVRIAASQGESVGALTVDDADEVLGINNRLQLATVEAIARRRIRERWLLDGITMIDPTSVFIDATVAIGRDTIILPNTMIEGSTRVGSGCTIGPSSVIRDSTIGSDCRVTASVIEGSELEDHVDVGPFSHLRPGVHLETGVHVGNFSELKNSRLGSRSAMGHFGYVGDATIGSDVNLGAGLVTCNYDGKEKHRTLIGPGAFIGSDTMLVAPVRIGDGASTGAGSVVTNDVPSGRTAVGVPARLLDRRSKK
jgi:bifunctional UDP-N-acetylglucosamine pyrophosphorylase/glucosamine-1-phosphate N-acetyltransferase